jgi:hypothetical protein
LAPTSSELSRWIDDVERVTDRIGVTPARAEN